MGVFGTILIMYGISNLNAFLQEKQTDPLLGFGTFLFLVGQFLIIIREDKIYQIPSLIQSGGQEGMQTLDQDLQRLLTKGSLERKMAKSIAEKPKLFAQNVL